MPYKSDACFSILSVDDDWNPDGDLRKSVWEDSPKTSFDTSYAPDIHHPEAETTVAARWSPPALYLAFWCRYTSLNIFEADDPSQQTWGLWDRDVAEVFLNPFPEKIERYWEFEVAPNNLWIDLEINLGRSPFYNADWHSNFAHATLIEPDLKQWTCEMRIPVRSFGLDKIETGMSWRGNFYRCDGPGDDTVRRFLAWNPTFEKNFHVPQYFGELLFID